MRVGLWNVEGLCRNLKNGIADKIKSCDIFACTETWHTRQSNIHIANYKQFNEPAQKTKKKGRPSGGVIFYYKKAYDGAFACIRSSLKNTMWIRIKGSYLNEKYDIYACVTYIKTGTFTSNSNIPIKFEKEIERFSAMGKLLLLGDFNGRTGVLDDFMNESHSNEDVMPLPINYISDVYLPRNNLDIKVTTNGRSLINICKTSGLRILNGRFPGDFLGHFTCITPRGNSVIDYMIASEDLLRRTVSFSVGLHTEFSEHCPIFASFSFNIQTEEVLCNEDGDLFPHKARYIWSDGSHDRYIMALLSTKSQDKLAKFLTESYGTSKKDANDAANTMADIIILAGEASLKVKRPRKKTNYKKNKSWFDRECKNIQVEMKTLAKLLKHAPYDKHLYSLYSTKRLQLKKLCKLKKRSLKNNILNSLLSLQDTNPKAFWTLLKNMDDESSTDSPGMSIPSKHWYDYFHKLSVTEQRQLPPDLHNEFNDLEKQSLSTNSALNMPITISEVKQIIKRIKINKAPGDDQILPEMVKYGQPVILTALTKLFNIVLKSKVFPDNWNISLQSPLHKGGDPLDTNNYRGISLISCLGKCFTAIMAERLYYFVNSTAKLGKEQCAFRKGYRTTDNIFCLKSIINKYINNTKGKLYACFIDFRKAFDCVWREALFYKLLKLGIDGNFYQIIKSMYTSTTAKVKLANGVSDVFSPNMGIKQGDCLSPLLFNLFINDISDHLVNTDPVKIGNIDLSHLLFADDLLLLSKSKTGLQNALDSLYNYCDTWGLTVNLQKTNIIIFQKRISKKGDQNDIFMYGDTQVAHTDSYTYLGIVFQRNGSFNLAAANLKSKAIKASFKMFSLLSTSNNINITLLLKLFDVLIKPIATYGCEVWAATFLTNIFRDKNSNDYFKQLDKISFEMVHNRFCKRILGVYSSTSNVFSRAEVGRLPLSIFVSKLIAKYWLYIIKLDPQRIVYQAYISERQLDECHTLSWVSFIKQLLTKCDLIAEWENQSVENETSFLKTIEATLLKDYASTYDNVGQNQYLPNNDNINTMPNYLKHAIPVKYRKAISRLRLGSNRLEIIRGKYTKTPRENRICKFCSPDEHIGDELHFLLSCPKHKSRRDELFKTMIELEPLFASLQGKEKADILLNPYNEGISMCVGRFIYNSFLEY